VPGDLLGLVACRDACSLSPIVVSQKGLIIGGFEQAVRPILRQQQQEWPF